MTELWNWQKYLHIRPALSILGISYISARLVIHWMLNMCLSEMLPKGLLNKEISAVFFQGSSWFLHSHYSCEPSQLKITQMEQLDLGSFQSFMDQTQHHFFLPTTHLSQQYPCCLRTNGFNFAGPKNCAFFPLT